MAQRQGYFGFVKGGGASVVLYFCGYAVWGFGGVSAGQLRDRATGAVANAAHAGRVFCGGTADSLVGGGAEYGSHDFRRGYALSYHRVCAGRGTGRQLALVEYAHWWYTKHGNLRAALAPKRRLDR